MATFYVKAQLRGITDSISSWCKDKNLQLVRELSVSGSDDDLYIEYTKDGLKGYASIVIWEIQNISDKQIVKLIIKPNTFVRVCYFFPFLVILSLFSYYLINPSSSIKQLITYIIISFIASIFIISIGNFVRNVIVKLEKSFWQLVQTEYKIIQVTPIDIDIIQRQYLLLISSVISVLVGIILYKFLGIFLCLLIMIVVFIVLFFEISKKYCSFEYFGWKQKIFEIEFNWIILCGIFINIFLVFTYINSFFIIIKKELSLQKRRFDFEIILTSIPKYMFDRRIESIEQENKEILNFLVEKAKKMTKNNNNQSISKKILVNFRLLLGLFFIFTYFFQIYLFLHCIREIFLSSKEWSNSVLYSEECKDEKSLIPPSTYLFQENKNRIFSIILLINFVLGGLITISAGIISLDVLFYILQGETIILKFIQIPISWMQTIFIFICGNTFGSILCYIILCFCSFPFYVFLFNFVLRLGKYIYIHFFLYNKHDFESMSLESQNKLDSINKFIKDVSKNFNLVKPKLIVKKHTQNPLEIKGRFNSKRSIICLDISFFNNLSINELKALIAHELGHLKQGLKKVECLKILSALTFYPNNYLSLLIDPFHCEIEADKFSNTVMGNSKYLINALIKLTLIPVKEITSVKIKKTSRIIRFIEKIFRVKGIKAVYDFFFGEVLLGYSYPVLSSRIAFLKGFKHEKRI